MNMKASKTNQPIGREAGMSLLGGLMVLAVIGIVLTLAARYFL